MILFIKVLNNYNIYNNNSNRLILLMLMLVLL